MVKQISQSMLQKQWNEAGCYKNNGMKWDLSEQPDIFTLAEGIDKTTF